MRPNERGKEERFFEKVNQISLNHEEKEKEKINKTIHFH